ncbi:adenylate/guanylate cyclase domain-containing protein [Flagellimonas aquimarina]|uniref:Adenylate/guanylate cyclase domain-containing protein n=1 Tax=Flagellimonas aquimarina TaxID=2201895 RepID=A0A316L4N3_9FLAO|nr:adenylate/guanylate cyclase domain-containing protein [Allomuricauda koreensis]PWL40378.1 adenylate/guanylate cyclase domain-containing protein [Allomuricauda koreensis]
MNRNLQHFFNVLWKSLLFWSLAMGLFGVFRYFGIRDDEGFSVTGDFAQLHTSTIVLHHVFTGLAIGFLYATIDFIFERFGSKKVSLGLSLIIKTITYFISTILVFTLVLEIFSELGQININNEIGWWRTNKTFWAILLYVVLLSLVFAFIKIAVEKFGKGVFLKMLLGKYKNPKEEKRIFMFLDLKDSTTIAEQLGHFKYSQLIQDCFYDLNNVVPKYDAEIYQYVGDEAVLSWPYKKGLANNNCVGLFFAFQQQKWEKSEYYLEKYGVIPEFKAGLHGGVLMVAEVGIVKKELAYHGDVINTSARIQGECNKHNVHILISEELLKDLKVGGIFSSKSLGKVLLKGKHKEVKIHTIQMT